MFAIPKCLTHIQIYNDVSVKRNKTFIMFIIVLEQHFSILTESSSDPKKTDPYLKC